MNNIEQNILLYTAPNGDVRIDVFIEDETVWLTQKSMAELFGVEVHTINYHLKEIYKSLELQEDRTIRKIRTVQLEGNRNVTRNIEYYNLDSMVQNKFHFAVTGKTAAEIIYQSAKNHFRF